MRVDRTKARAAIASAATSTAREMCASAEAERAPHVSTTARNERTSAFTGNTLRLLIRPVAPR
jgi:hypothetical protein